jgi:hypothetical protein
MGSDGLVEAQPAAASDSPPANAPVFVDAAVSLAGTGSLTVTPKRERRTAKLAGIERAKRVMVRRPRPRGAGRPAARRTSRSTARGSPDDDPSESESEPEPLAAEAGA